MVHWFVPVIWVAHVEITGRKRRGAAPLSTLETYRSSVSDAKCGNDVNMVTGVSEAWEALGG